MEPSTGWAIFLRPFAAVVFLMFVWYLKKWLYRLFKPGKLRDTLYRERASWGLLLERKIAQGYRRAVGRQKIERRRNG